MRLDLDANHQLQVPPLSKPMTVGWYQRSPTPGDVATCTYAAGCVGRTVLAAHINGNGQQGAFGKLAKLKAGNEVDAYRSDGKVAVFKVTDVLVFPKSDFGAHQEEIYGDTQVPELAMITCGPGDLDTVAHSYRQQTVVLARLADFKPAS